MSQIIRRKQIEYFTAYAGSCLEIWNSIVGQRITHEDDWIGTVVGVKKIDDSIEIEVQLIKGLHRWDTLTKRFRFGKEHRLSKVFTHLTLPREIEKNSETHYWDNEEHLIYGLRNLASQASIDQPTSNTFNGIYNQLMRTDRKRKLSGQTIQEINNYRQILIDKMVYELRNLASQASIDTFNEIYNQLMRMNQNRKLPGQAIQEINNYRQILIDKMVYELRNLASQASIDTFNEIYNQLMRMNQNRKLPGQTIQKINNYRQILMGKMQISMDITRFTNLSEKAMNPNVRACFPLPELDDEDIQLVSKWCDLNDLNRTSLVQIMKTDSKTARQLCRLLSARFAEKTAMYFYQNQDKTVEDISITQINKNNSDWCKYDLKVDGYPVDVKNSRQSQKSKDRYTEYCIPRFKSSREGQNVIISGVFSPYIRASKLSELLESTERHKNDKILFLGETTLKKQQILKKEFGSLVHFKNPNPTIDYLLPPWVFDYPEYIYTERDNALKKLKGFSDLALLKDNPYLIPVAIAAGIDLKKILDKETDHWEWCFLNQLCTRIKEYGLSLPFLFLTILDHFRDMATGSKTVSDFEPEDYRKFLFYKGRNNLPLGIYDPLKTIDALIKALGILWTAESESIRKFCEFRLVSFNILQGKSNPNDRLWTTLIAYCGGKIKKAPCGKNPLVLGESELRDKCRKLICPECGFCCEKCEEHHLLPGPVPLPEVRTAHVRPRTPNLDGKFDENAQALFNALRHYRMSLAREKNVPPYVIASDRTLRDIVLLRPTNLKELELAHGISPAKAEKYGDGLLAIVQQAT